MSASETESDVHKTEIRNGRSIMSDPDITGPKATHENGKDKAPAGEKDMVPAGEKDKDKDTAADKEKGPDTEANGGDDAVADPNIVGWDGPDDPANPRNWSKRRKMFNVSLVSLSVFYSNIATTMFAPGASKLAEEFGITSTVIMTLAVSIPSLGASLGPLLFAPLSEVTGRVPIYWASSTLYLAMTFGCAFSTNAGMFLFFRVICGACAASFMTVGGGTIADLLPKEERGTATAMFSIGPLLGPVTGPVIGGFVTGRLGWRWTFYLVLMFAGVVTITAMITMRETNATEILTKKAARLRKETGNLELRPANAKNVEVRQLVERALIRPFRILLFSPIVSLIGLYMGLVFGLTFLLFATFPSVFEETYGWAVDVSGLAYLGIGVGATIGLGIFAKTSDRLLRVGGGPERRLPLMIWFGPCVPIGIFIYAWSTEYKVHWIVAIIGTAFIGIGVMMVTSSSQLYMMDMYGPQGAASALAAATLVRNGYGAFLPLAADPLYKSLGLGWGNSVLGFIAIAFLPVPILFYKYGLYLRERFPLKL